MSFRNLDLNLLRVFDTVMDERNLTRSAQRLMMTQPAVSNAMRRMRESLGHDLFNRTPKGVTPTAYAESLWPAVRVALAALRDVIDPLDFDPRTTAHSFHVAMADATAALLMPPLVCALEMHAAAVNLRVIPLTTRDPRPLLDEGQVDIAVGVFPAAAAMGVDGAATSFAVEALYTSEYVCVMRRGHPLAEPGAMTLDQYCAARHLLVSFSGRPHGFVDEALTAIARSRRIVLTVNQFFTAGRVVAQSDLLTVLPRHFVASTGFADELALAELPFPIADIRVDLLWHRRTQHNPAQRWLRAAVIAAAAAAPTPDPAVIN
jgi:DNA-binding transcriptional LysR family regulator